MDGNEQQYNHNFDPRRASLPAGYPNGHVSSQQYGFVVPGQPASRSYPHTWLQPNVLLSQDTYGHLSQDSDSASQIDLRPFDLPPSAAAGLSTSSLIKSNDRPWHPQQSFDNWSISQNPSVASYDLQSIRDSSDSGYNTQTAKATGPTSAPLPRNPKSTIGKGRSSRASSTQGASEVTSQAGTASNKRKSISSLPPCPECNKTPGSKSEQTKHAKTHSRPWKCSVATCPDHERGFGTINDRDRHEMCKHDIYKAGVPYHFYVCSACPAAASAKEKPWPRLDNFKAHLKRKHPEGGEEAWANIIAESKRERTGDTMTVVSAAHTAQLPQSQADEEQQYQNDFNAYTPMTHFQPPGLSRQATSQGDVMQWLPPGDMNDLAGVGVGVDLDINSFNELMSTAHQLQEYNNQFQASLFPLQASAVAGPSTSRLMPTMNNRPMQQEQHGYDQQDIMQGIDNLMEFSDDDNDEELDDPSNRKRRKTTMFNGLDAYIDDGASEQCKYCGKTGESLKRPCNMRKHVSRHKRRYGCTEPRCYDKHGSKSDWIRHEDKVHRLPPSYLCRLKEHQGGFCNAYYHSEKTYQYHLRTKHGLTDQINLAQVTEEMYLPQQGRERYWCGFCQEVVKNDKQDYWNARCLHVGKHMDVAGGKSIHDWVCPELQKRKGDITEEDKKELQNRPPAEYALD